ncbi:MCE family protein [Nocardioides sp. TRM66260-LWL]|uniref:MCE family protein n=1 Tax=Nocardioides sp. TRM66260-LWL TaxID=2874478 RepID=UPI001CC60033|nr:MlaD family protein [Nocardioides sp. TRM66260-LWL]MBZ5736287.1 MCE family protein [Nocardioides sp. TRM66260-LWL]
MSRLRSLVANRLYLSAVGVVGVLVVTVAYLFGGVLDRPLTAQPIDVRVTMSATGGLFEGSAVTYRGVSVGRVTDISVTPDGVVATARINDLEVPADTRVQVRSLSPVGEQYLDLQPRRTGGPYLTDGSTLQARADDLPATLGNTVVAVSRLLDQIDDRKLRSLLTELSTGLRGTGQDIGRLVDQAGLLLDELDRAYPETARLLRNLEPATGAITDNRVQLGELGTSAKSLAGFLRAYDPRLRRLIDRTPGQLAQLDRLIADARAVLPDFLSRGLVLGDILTRQDAGFRELLTQYAPGLATLQKVVHDDKLFISIVLKDDARCRYGTPQREPRDIGPRALPTTGACPAAGGPQRGAAYAPGS